MNKLNEFKSLLYNNQLEKALYLLETNQVNKQEAKLIIEDYLNKKDSLIYSIIQCFQKSSKKS